MNQTNKDPLKTPNVIAHALKDDGTVPNNDGLPLLVYQAAVELPAADPPSVFEKVFSQNGWSGSWRNGIYSFHHYHSTAHEVLGIAQGNARVQFGGENGVILTVNPGDVVIIPAGVAHNNLGASRDLCVVGAYPAGQHQDLCRGKSNERLWAKQNIANVALPKSDPVYGPKGPLFDHWRKPDEVSS